MSSTDDVSSPADTPPVDTDLDLPVGESGDGSTPEWVYIVIGVAVVGGIMALAG